MFYNKGAGVEGLQSLGHGKRKLYNCWCSKDFRARSLDTLLVSRHFEQQNYCLMGKDLSTDLALLARWG